MAGVAGGWYGREPRTSSPGHRNGPRGSPLHTITDGRDERDRRPCPNSETLLPQLSQSGLLEPSCLAIGNGSAPARVKAWPARRVAGRGKADIMSTWGWRSGTTRRVRSALPRGPRWMQRRFPTGYARTSNSPRPRTSWSRYYAAWTPNPGRSAVPTRRLREGWACITGPEIRAALVGGLPQWWNTRN